MAEPTLTQIFGTNATQDVNSIVIDKTDLSNLTATSDNSAESLLVAILLKAYNYLTQTNFDENIEQSIFIEKGLSNFLTRGTNNDSYRTDPLTVNLAKLDTGAVLDPDDY